MQSQLSADQFISQLYREAAQVPLASFAQWALDLLQQVIAFDGAVWATGHVEQQTFHTQTCVDVPTEILDRLKQYLAINPIFPALVANIGHAVDMTEVIDDHQFYQSTLYQQCFQPLGIERILSSIHVEQDSGIFTLLSLYRYDRQQPFSPAEKATQDRLLYHLLSASSYRQFLALKDTSAKLTSALCDQQGHYHAVEPEFISLLHEQLGTVSSQKFPLAINSTASQYQLGQLQVIQQPLGELLRISIRNLQPLDQLTLREQQVVSGLCSGQTFKQIAKTLHLSPSTVSNHLYRIYAKLSINSRSELIALAH